MHLADHRDNNYLRIAKIKVGYRNAGLYVPEYHTMNDGRYEPGTSALFDSVIIPHDTRIDDNGNVYCRHCNGTEHAPVKLFVPNSEVSIMAKALRVTKMREHEMNCKGNVIDERVLWRRRWCGEKRQYRS